VTAVSGARMPDRDALPLASIPLISSGPRGLQHSEGISGTDPLISLAPQSGHGIRIVGCVRLRVWPLSFTH
jgi:hypothetical protein